MPWGAGAFAGSAFGNLILFSLKKYVENPAALIFILSLPGYTSLILGPSCAYLSDRIWTRFGRRKPFVVFSWTVQILTLFLMPFMPNFWSVVGLFLLYCMACDFSAPIEPLKLEIIPPHQRGRATAAMQWLQNGSNLVFWFVAIGRFDDERFMGGHLLSGETLIYLMGGLTLLCVVSILVFGIHETNPHPHGGGPRHKISIFDFFKSIADKDLWPVYFLNFGGAIYATGLGPLGNLLYTDQWHYTKQEMGINIAVGGVLNIFLIGGLAVIADRLNRLKALQTLMCAVLVVNAVYYFYVEMVLPDRRPSLVELILFGETLSIMWTLMGLVSTPLVYDYVVRDKMGTYGAGANLLGRVTGIITLNILALFYWFYAVWFGAPAGEMSRICLKNDITAPEMRQLIDRGHWSYPDPEAPVSSKEVSGVPWYATGLVKNDGTCWELRLRDKRSEDAKTQLDSLNGDLSPVQAQEKMYQDNAQAAQRKNDAAGFASNTAQANALKVKVDAFNAKINPLQATLDARAKAFADEVKQNFAGELLPEGEQIVEAHAQKAQVTEWRVKERPGAGLEKTLVEMRRKHPELIDIRPTKIGDRFGVAISALLEPKTDPKLLAQQLVLDTAMLSAHRDPGLFPDAPQMASQRTEQALVMTLRTVEDPVDRLVSPVTRAVNSVLARFDNGAPPEKRMASTARSLRQVGETEHVGIGEAPGPQHMITVSTILLPGATSWKLDDPINARLKKLLGNQASPVFLAQSRAFYDRLVDYAVVERITVEQPFLDHSYQPNRYDYMVGYISLFLMGLIGIGITFAFARREKKGLIRKLGVEEAGDIEYAEAKL